MIEDTANVAIVGGGISGILSLKHCLESGLKPILFDDKPSPGGVWELNSGSMYEGLNANISKFCMEFDDFFWPATAPLYPPAEEINKYINDYVKKKDLLQYMKFNSKVKLIKRSSKDSSGWEITVENPNELKKQIKFVSQKVIVATGKYTEPIIPPIPGLNEYKIKNKVIHSKEYKTHNDYKDKTVLIVGASISFWQ